MSTTSTKIKPRKSHMIKNNRASIIVAEYLTTIESLEDTGNRPLISQEQFTRAVAERLDDIGDCPDADGIALAWTLRTYGIARASACNQSLVNQECSEAERLEFLVDIPEAEGIALAWASRTLQHYCRPRTSTAAA